MDKTQVYIERINKVIDYVELNLGNKIDLDELAHVACLSKYHFHELMTEKKFDKIIDGLV